MKCKTNCKNGGLHNYSFIESHDDNYDEYICDVCGMVHLFHKSFRLFIDEILEDEE